MMAPAGTAVPSNTFTPRRWAAESRPLRVDPPPLVFDTASSSNRRTRIPTCSAAAGHGDGGHLERRIALTVAPATPAPGLGLIGEAPDLGPELLPHHPGGDRGAGELLGGGEDPVVVHHEHRLELDLVALARAEQLDPQLLPLGDALVLATRSDHCVHSPKSL